MAVNVETLEKLERKITLELPVDTIQKEVESRLKRWHALEVSADGSLGAPFEAEAAQLNSSGHRVLASSEAAAGVLTSHVAVPHPWSALATFFAQSGFLRAESRPDALNVANDFATWSGARHR